MSNDVIRLGIVGMSPTNMASTFALLKNEPDLRYEITAICARRREVLDQCLSQFGVPFGTLDYRELAQQDDVDVVCVFTPDHLHADHCAAAIEADKHVVCTKPMVTSLEEAQRLVALVREHGVKFLVGETMRFDRQFEMAKKLFDDGDLGDLIAIESYYVHDLRSVFEFTPWRLTVPQDFLYGGCCHSVDAIRAFAGDVDTVHANATRGNLTPGYDLEDNFFLNVKFKSGVIGRVSGLYGIIHPPTPMMQVGIYGTKGSLQTEFTDNEPGQVRVVLDKLVDHKPLVADFEPETDLSAYGLGASVIRYMRHFQDCLDNDLEPVPGVVESAKTMAVIAAAWESIHTGQVVKACNEF